jgi:hypothetical protein
MGPPMPAPLVCIASSTLIDPAFGLRKRPPEKANGNKMLTALILICSISSVSNAVVCTEQNAVHVLRSPETFASPVACLMHGDIYT